MMKNKGTAPSVLDEIESYAIQKRKADKRRRDAEYRARNRKKINAKKREWWEEHKAELNARQRERYAKKKAEKQKQAPKKEVFTYENP